MTAAVERVPAVQLDWSPVFAGDELVGYRARLVGVGARRASGPWPAGRQYVDRQGSALEHVWAESIDPVFTGPLGDGGWVCFVQLMGRGRWLLTTQGGHPSGRRHRSFGSCTVPSAQSLQAAFDRAESWARRRFRAVAA